MNLRTIAQAVLVLLASWGVGLSALLWLGQLPEALLPEPSTEGEPGGEEGDLSADGEGARGLGEDAPLGATAESAANGSATLTLSRYSVCAREESPPRLTPLSGERTGARFAVHCGPSVHLIGFDTADGLLAPRRIARLTLATSGPARSWPQPSPIASGDLDRDGVADLVLAQRWLDSAGSPVSGVLFLVRGLRGGGLSPIAERVAGPLAVAAHVGPLGALLGAGPGDDLALLHAPDPRLAQPSELWLFAGGPALERRARQPATTSAEALLAADLDADGSPELIVLAPSRGLVEIHASPRTGAGAAAESAKLTLAVPGLRAGLLADLNGDGADDLVLHGEQLFARFAGAGALDEIEALTAELTDLRLSSTDDSNADGKLDLVGYAHPSVVSLEQVSSTVFERRVLVSLLGDAVAVHDARIAELDGRPGLDLLVLAVSDAAEGSVELLLGDAIGGGARAQLSRSAVPLPDAPLNQRLVLP